MKYVLPLGVPPSPLSLGIPSYSEWWYPTYDAKDGPRMTGGGLTYEAAQGILARNGAKANWDDRQKEGMASVRTRESMSSCSSLTRGRSRRG